MMTYFEMKEFECRDGCRMPAAAKENIEALVEQVLDPVRRAYGKAICVPADTAARVITPELTACRRVSTSLVRRPTSVLRSRKTVRSNGLQGQSWPTASGIR